jgi:hypothetical protein
MNPVAEAFEPILGLPSWLVTNTHGSWVTFEFGDPDLRIGKILQVPVNIPNAPSKVSRRDVYVRGAWHLWIANCEWSLTINGVQLAQCESDDGVCPAFS